MCHTAPVLKERLLKVGKYNCGLLIFFGLIVQYTSELIRVKCFIANKAQLNKFQHVYSWRGGAVMSHTYHSDAHQSCTLMLPVSKHAAHLSPMERV